MKLRRGTAAILFGVLFLILAATQVRYALDATTRILMFVPGGLFTLVGLFLRLRPESSNELAQTSEPTPSPDEVRRERAVQAAKKSWILPLFGLVLGAFGAGNIVVALSILVGIWYAVFAMSQASKCGNDGIRTPAIIGLLLSLSLAGFYALPFLLITASR